MQSPGFFIFFLSRGDKRARSARFASWLRLLVVFHIFPMLVVFNIFPLLVVFHVFPDTGLTMPSCC